MTQEVFTDKRLLGALDYIDERFIAEVTEDYEAFEVPGVYKPNKRAHFRAYRQFVALAACLILISAAFPVVTYVLPQIDINIGNWGGNAGAGKDYDPQSSIIFDYPVDMPAEEIYADLFTGDWVVYENVSMVTGENLWSEFYQKVRDKEPASFRQAWYITTGGRSDFLPSEIENDGKPYLELLEIAYDGETFYYSFRFMQPSVLYDDEIIKEYKYLKRSKDRSVYYLTNDPMLEYGDWWWLSSAGSPDAMVVFRDKNFEK